MVLAVFVLKSSSAKRQNINIVSLFLVVLAPDDVPAEARLTLLRGSFFALGFGLSQVSDARETNAPALPPSGMSLFFLVFFLERDVSHLLSRSHALPFVLNSPSWL